MKLKRDNNQKIIQYDTIVSLDYLLQETIKDNSLSNFDFFETLNYPTLESKAIGDSNLIIFNDSIEISILVEPFDTVQFARNLSSDSAYYSNNPFYGLDELKLSKETQYLPTREISEISIRINGELKKMPFENYENLFEPNIISTDNHFPAKVYLTDTEEILLQMDNGSGAGFYYVIFVLDKEGNLKRRIIKRVI